MAQQQQGEMGPVIRGSLILTVFVPGEKSGQAERDFWN